MQSQGTALAERHTKITEIDDETGEHFDICSTCGDADWPCVYVQLAGAQKRVDRLRDQMYRFGTRDSHRFWLCKLMPYAWSLRHEWRRILDWRQRHRDGRRYGWLEAWRSVVENPPTFDHYWDQEMEDRCYCSGGPQSCTWLTAVMGAVR